MNPPNRPRLVAFDLDGVLTGPDTMADVVRHRLRARPALLLLAAPLAALHTATIHWPAAHQRCARGLVRLALVGLSPQQARQLLRSAGERMAATPGFLLPDGLDCLRSHLSRPDDHVVVITASDQGLAESLLLHAGFPPVQILGSGISPAAGGPRLHPHNIGRDKIVALHRAGLPTTPDLLYTDSAADLPLAMRSRRTTLIDPDRHTRMAMTRAHVTGLSEMNWRTRTG